MSMMTRALKGVNIGDGQAVRGSRGPSPDEILTSIYTGSGTQPLFLPHPRTGGAQAMDPSDPRTWLRPVRWT